jgi:hypothetical protein
LNRSLRRRVAFGHHFGLTLSSRWHHFGFISASFWHHFGIISVSRWYHFGITLPSFGHPNVAKMDATNHGNRNASVKLIVGANN